MTRVGVLLAIVLVAGCHKTPPEQYPDRPLCGAVEAQACTIMIAGAQKDCTDGKGFYCARCLPINSALDWCFLDGADTGDTKAGRWYTCVHDCNACTPAEALAIDAKARCATAETAAALTVEDMAQ